MTIADEILSLVRETLEVGAIDPDASWADYDDLESFALVELLVAIQEKYRIQFHPHDLRGVSRVRDLVELVEKKLATRG